VQVLNWLRYGLFVIIIFFLFSVFVVIYHSIWNAVFFFRDEIKITELVGGMRRYIYWPFMLQGTIYSVIACVISASVFYYVATHARIDVIIWSTYSVDVFVSSSAWYIFATIASVIFLWGASGLVASWRFEK
jgi:cell division protein FtsX